jgi:hypothetical protein
VTVSVLIHHIHIKELPMKFSTSQAAIALAIAAVCGGANATVLTFNLPAGSVDQVDAPFGGVLLDSAITNINNPNYAGIARAAVYDTGTGLDFYYQFSNFAAPLSTHGIERFGLGDFESLGAVAVNVYQTGTAFGIFSAGTEKADGADRTSLGVIGFSFVPNGSSKINPGTTSFTEIIRTNARTYTTGNFGLLDGYGDNAKSFSPTAVPEPESYALLLAGMGLIGTIIRRRQQK